MEYIYGLDVSLSCTGVAIFSQDGKVKKLFSIETDSKSETQHRLKKLGKELLRMRREYKPKIVVFEQGFSLHALSTQQVFKAHGVCQYVFSDKEQVYYYPTTIRKIVYGKGNIDKKTMQDYILSKYKNIKFKNMDESDAFSICLAWFIDKGILKLGQNN